MIEVPFDCPHCGALVTEETEESSVGGVIEPEYPHIFCPHCDLCTGCKNPVKQAFHDEVHK